MRDIRKSDLVAVTIPPGPAWPEIIRNVWEARAALLPVDHRLRRSEIEQLLAAARPTALLGPHGNLRRREDGAPVNPEIALVVATSGTEGRPRPVELTHGALRAAVEASAARLGCAPEDGWMCALPVSHVGGMLVVVRALLLGAPLVVHERFDVGAFEREREARFTALVPTMLARLLDAGADLARFRAVLVGGANLAQDLAERASGAGARLVTTYGLTESCGGVVYDGVPLAGTEVALGDDGEILLSGPTIMRGYRLDPDATATALDGRWLHTRDAGAIDGAGRLRVLGRLDDVIVTGGEKVWPSEVEMVLRRHPSIAQAAVVGAPDAEWGRRVVAFIVLRDPSENLDDEDVRRFASASLAPYKMPKKIRIVADLPRTRSGKLRRRSLLASG